MTAKVPKISRSEVLRYLGYRGQAVDDELLARLDEVIAQCERELKPRGVFRIFERALSPAENDALPAIFLQGSSLVLEGKSIVRHLQGAQLVAVMACTLGAKSEQRLRQLSALDPLAAIIYDASCSALVEEGAEELTASIGKEADSLGMTTNRRYSPGYGDFPLSTQAPLLRSIDAGRRLGLTSNESNLLIPSKSITAVVGLFKEREGECR